MQTKFGTMTDRLVNAIKSKQWVSRFESAIFVVVVEATVPHPHLLYRERKRLPKALADKRRHKRNKQLLAWEIISDLFVSSSFWHFTGHTHATSLIVWIRIGKFLFFLIRRTEFTSNFSRHIIYIFVVVYLYFID